MNVIDGNGRPHALRVRRLAQIAVCAWLPFLGCATHRAHVDELSVVEHRDQAELERRIAAAQRTSGPRHATPTARHDGVPAGAPIMHEASASTDSDWRLLEAAHHLLHAKQHEKAAETLERFEDAACKTLSSKERAACPMLSGVEAVSPIPGGVRIVFRPDADVARIFSRMRCHLAYARARAFVEEQSCPLYVRGVRIARAEQGGFIEITATEPPLVEAIRSRVREEVAVSH